MFGISKKGQQKEVMLILVKNVENVFLFIYVIIYYYLYFRCRILFCLPGSVPTNAENKPTPLVCGDVFMMCEDVS